MCRPMPKDRTTDRVFQFHGKQCGSCDKTDDTTKTNTADSWKLYGVICKAFGFHSQVDKKKSTKRKFQHRKLELHTESSP